MPARARRRILVVNPNSNEVVTQGLADALAPVLFSDGPDIDIASHDVLASDELGGRLVLDQFEVFAVAGAAQTLE